MVRSCHDDAPPDGDLTVMTWNFAMRHVVTFPCHGIGNANGMKGFQMPWSERVWSMNSSLLLIPAVMPGPAMQPPHMGSMPRPPLRPKLTILLRKKFRCLTRGAKRRRRIFALAAGPCRPARIRNSAGILFSYR